MQLEKSVEDLRNTAVSLFKQKANIDWDKIEANKNMTEIALNLVHTMEEDLVELEAFYTYLYNNKIDVPDRVADFMSVEIRTTIYAIEVANTVKSVRAVTE